MLTMAVHVDAAHLLPRQLQPSAAQRCCYITLAGCSCHSNLLLHVRVFTDLQEEEEQEQEASKPKKQTSKSKSVSKKDEAAAKKQAELAEDESQVAFHQCCSSMKHAVAGLHAVQSYDMHAAPGMTVCVSVSVFVSFSLHPSQLT